MKTSETIGEITAALLKCDMPNMKKDTKGYGYKYVTLDQIIEKVTPILRSQDIIFLQSVSEAKEGYIGVTTRLQHSSGEYFQDSFELPKTDMKGVNSTQAMGASITYGRRYGLTTMLGLATEEDTDGTTAKKVSKKMDNMNKKLDSVFDDENPSIFEDLKNLDTQCIKEIEALEKYMLQNKGKYKDFKQTEEETRQAFLGAISTSFRKNIINDKLKKMKSWFEKKEKELKNV